MGRRTLYSLLGLYILISGGYYVAGVLALNQIWFHGDRYARGAMDLDGRTINKDLTPESRESGIRPGDVLETIQGQPFTGEAQLIRIMRAMRPGQTLDVTLRRGGQLVNARLRLRPIEGPGFSLGGYILYLTPVAGVTLLSLLVGYWVVAARPRDTNAWLVLVLLSFWETAYGDLHATWWPGVWYAGFSAWHSLVQCMVTPALVWFGLFFPERSRLDRRAPWLKWMLLAFFIFTLAESLGYRYVISFDVSQTPGWTALDQWMSLFFNWLQALCVLLYLAVVIDNFRSATADARRRLRILMIGSLTGLGGLVIIFTVFPLFGLNAHTGSLFELVVPFAAIFPLTLAYVLVVQRAMDVRVLLQMGTKYVLAKATLVGLQAALFGWLLLGVIVPMMQRREHETLTTILLVVMVAVVVRLFLMRDSLSNRMQHWLDRKFFRESYDAEVVLSDLSDHARTFAEKGPLVDIVSRRISEVLHVPRVAVWLRGSPVFHLELTLGFVANTAILLQEDSPTVDNLTKTLRPATVYRDRPDEWLQRTGVQERMILEEVQAELLLPLPGRTKLMGLMALGPKQSQEPYTPMDLRVLQSVATQTGLALEVSELAESLASEAANRARADREIEIAHEVQERLFPQTIPAVPGLDLAGHCRPAQGVGGDYYDMIELADGRLGLAIGDVSGKGVPSALLMASLRACLRTMMLLGVVDLADLMRRMNQLVYEASAVNRYATFFFSIYDPATGILRYVNAGHNPPMLMKHGSSVQLEACGPVIGLLRHVEFEEQSVHMEAGDLLITYTDGISEAMTTDDEEWGEERMVQAAESLRDGTAGEILRGMFLAADLFTSNAPQHDDMTLMVVKRS